MPSALRVFGGALKLPQRSFDRLYVILNGGVPPVTVVASGNT